MIHLPFIQVRVIDDGNIRIIFCLVLYGFICTMVSFQMSSGNFKVAPFRYVFFLSCQLQLHVLPRIRSAGH